MITDIMVQPFSSRIKQFFLTNLVLILIFCLSLSIWILFYPAYMSADAIAQYMQALAGTYDDWHPPIMAVILHYVLIMGGSISILTLTQTLSGCFGIYFLAQEILLQKNASSKKITWAPFYILLILIL